MSSSVSGIWAVPLPGGLSFSLSRAASVTRAPCSCPLPGSRWGIRCSLLAGSLAGRPPVPRACLALLGSHSPCFCASCVKAGRCCDSPAGSTAVTHHRCPVVWWPRFPPLPSGCCFPVSNVPSVVGAWGLTSARWESCVFASWDHAFCSTSAVLSEAEVERSTGTVCRAWSLRRFLSGSGLLICVRFLRLVALAALAPAISTRVVPRTS